MLVPVPPKFRKRRELGRAPAATPTPPASVDQVVSVVLDGSNAVIVTLGANVESITDPSQATWVRHDGGAFFNGNGAELIDDTHVRITYDDDVSACNLWMIGDPGTWQWADAGATVAPFDGSITP
jgi:hypothetical protein